MAEREPGFYWVRPPHDDWIVAEWTIDLGEELGDGGRWYLPANEISRPDYYFAEIGERVERGPKPETNAVYLTDPEPPER